MEIHVLQDFASLMTHAGHWVDGIQLLHWHWPADPLLGYGQVRETNLVGDIQKWFANFTKTGQAWAFIIGLVMGYLVKTFTTFG
jgi:hypothetical protein